VLLGQEANPGAEGREPAHAGPCIPIRSPAQASEKLNYLTNVPTLTHT
jgi:hypothetical protein